MLLFGLDLARATAVRHPYSIWGLVYDILFLAFYTPRQLAVIATFVGQHQAASGYRSEMDCYPEGKDSG